MKSLLYSVRNLTRTPGTQALKVISLTLGLAVSLLLFSKVTYELSFDRFFPDAERIHQIRIIYPAGLIPGLELSEEDDRVNGSFAPTMAEEFPQVEAATRFVRLAGERFTYGENVYSQRVIMADENFFDVFDLGIVAGDPKQLRTSYDVLLSESTARKIFANEDPIGKTLTFNKNPITVRAVFRDVPQNSHLRIDAILSIDIVSELWRWPEPTGWKGGDTYMSYIKLKPGTRLADVEAGMQPFLEKYLKPDLDEGITFPISPLKDIHMRSENTKPTVVLYTVLAILALFIAALNYVLVSVSSLTKRSRTIAVQKVNGARDGDIFGGFLIETALLILFCVGLAVLLILAFRREIEMFTAENLSTLFAPDRLAALAGVVVVFFAIAGLAPAYLFSRIPVKQAFAMSGINKRGWKKALLFTLFFGVSFAFVFLLIIVLQYRYFLNKDLGYDHSNVVHLSFQNVPKERYDLLASDLAGMPFVEGMALSNMMFYNGLDGLGVMDSERGEEHSFSSRNITFDHRMLPLYGITPIQGDNFREDSPAESILVNEEFVRQMGWTDNPIGKTVVAERRVKTVIGVLPDFQLAHLAAGRQPLAALPRIMRDSTSSSAQVSIRLNAVTPENITQLNHYFKERFPEQQQTVRLYDQTLESRYVDLKYFRNAVMAGAAITFLIAIMGLIGYVNDEVRLRRREIAIRKVNGATVADVLRVISKGIMTLALIAACFGCALAFFLGQNWLENFANKIGLSPWIFLTGGATVLAIIAATIVVRAWRAANENPVTAIKAE